MPDAGLVWVGCVMKIEPRLRGAYPARGVRAQLQTDPRHPAVHLFVATHAEFPAYRDQAPHMRNHPVPLAGVEINMHGGGWKIVRVAVGVFTHLHRARCQHKAARGGDFLLNHEAHQSNGMSVGLAQTVAELKPCGSHRHPKEIAKAQLDRALRGSAGHGLCMRGADPYGDGADAQKPQRITETCGAADGERWQVLVQVEIPLGHSVWPLCDHRVTVNRRHKSVMLTR